MKHAKSGVQYRQKTKKPHGSRGFFALYLPVVPLSNVYNILERFQYSKKEETSKEVYFLHIFDSIAVPTVIDIKTILRDALEENLDSAEAVEKYLSDYDRQMIVTSTDIDILVKDFSDIIADGINKTLHPGIYS